jgi:hypothetical protein
MLILDGTIAYIDPGTGSFLLQFLMAGIVGVFLYFRNGIKRLLRRLFRPHHPPPPEDGNPPNKQGT